MTAESATFLPANVESLAEINALIQRSKRHWPWPEGYLELALPLHRLDANYLIENDCFEVRSKDGHLIAFLAVIVTLEYVLLDQLWVDPPHIRTGVGRDLCNFLFERAWLLGWSKIVVYPDPPAEGFYTKLGFKDTGERIPSRVPGGPTFRVMLWTCRFPLSQAEGTIPATVPFLWVDQGATCGSRGDMPQEIPTRYDWLMFCVFRPLR